MESRLEWLTPLLKKSKLLLGCLRSKVMATSSLNPRDPNFDPLGFLDPARDHAPLEWQTALAHLHAARFHKSATSTAAAAARRKHLRYACEALEGCAPIAKWDHHVLLKVRLALTIHDRRACVDLYRGETRESVAGAKKAAEDAVTALGAEDEAAIVAKAMSDFGAQSAGANALVTHACRYAASRKAFDDLRVAVRSFKPLKEPLRVLVDALDVYDRVVAWRPQPSQRSQKGYPRDMVISEVATAGKEQAVELALYYAHQCGDLVVSDVSGECCVLLLAEGDGHSFSGGGGHGRRAASIGACVWHTHKSRTCGSGLVGVVLTLLTAVCAAVGVALLVLTGYAALCRAALVLCAVQCAVALATEDVRYPREKGCVPPLPPAPPRTRRRRRRASCMCFPPSCSPPHPPPPPPPPARASRPPQADVAVEARLIAAYVHRSFLTARVRDAAHPEGGARLPHHR